MPLDGFYFSYSSKTCALYLLIDARLFKLCDAWIADGGDAVVYVFVRQTVVLCS
jgi:hypothetical protein